MKVFSLVLVIAAFCYCCSTGDTERKRFVVNNDFDDLVKQFHFMESEISALQSKVASQDSAFKVLENTISQMQSREGSGAVYVRWGRTQCSSNGTELVYSGYGAGAWYDDKGSGSNLLCLPSDPMWNSYSSSKDESRGRLFGMEYQELQFANYLTNEDAPCAVCRVDVCNSVLMIPGRTRCYDGWKTEYSGYLVSNAYHYATSEYICLDANPETVYRGSADENGALLYSVEGVCGSLPCPPYENGRELTCVVCSK